MLQSYQKGNVTLEIGSMFAFNPFKHCMHNCACQDSASREKELMKKIIYEMCPIYLDKLPIGPTSKVDGWVSALSVSMLSCNEFVYVRHIFQVAE